MVRKAMSTTPFKCASPVAIMRRQIPDDADVVLEESQVDPRRIVVIEIAEDAFLDQLPDFSHGAREQEGVVYHDPEILPVCQLDQLFRLLGGRGKWLLDEHVLAVLQGGFGQIEVRADRRDYGDGVDLWGGQQVVRVRGDGQVGIRLPDPLERDRTLVTDRGEL